jgi:hypothetical protein
MWAEEFIADKPEYTLFIHMCLALDYTPIFEYCGPKNKVVLDYPESMVLLAYRDKWTGQYFKPDRSFRVPMVKPDLRKIHEVNDSEGDEGVVLVRPDGHRQKVKSLWYVQRHRAKELLNSEKRFILTLLEDTFDDALPLLDDEGKKKAERIAGSFLTKLNKFAKSVEDDYEGIRREYWDKKELALSDEPKHMKPYFFSLWDGKEPDAKTVVINRLSNSLTSQKKFDEWKALHGFNFDWEKELAD